MGRTVHTIANWVHSLLKEICVDTLTKSNQNFGKLMVSLVSMKFSERLKDNHGRIHIVSRHQRQGVGTIFILVQSLPILNHIIPNHISYT